MKKKLNRLLALALAVMMVASALPVVGARAGEEATWTKVTEVDEITAGGEFVFVAKDGEDYYAMPATVVSDQLAGTKVELTDDTLSVAEGHTWTIAPTDGGVDISAGGVYLGWSSSTNFHKEEASYSWKVDSGTEGFRFTASSDSAGNRQISFKHDTDKFGTFSKVNTSGYTFDLLVFKKGDGGPVTPKVKITGATPASGSTVALGATVKITTDPADATVQYAEVEDGADLSFKDAVGGEFTLPEIAGTYKYKIKATYDGHDEGTTELTYYVKNPDDIQTTDVVKKGATGEQFKVKGVVTFIDGRNIYVQDEKGGICAYPDAAVDGLKRGDVVTATGSYKVFNKLPELEKATVVKTDESTPALSATEKKIDEVTDADVCTYIKIVGAKVTDMSGDYITLNDGSEKTLRIYKAPVKPDGLAVGDTVTVTAAVGMYNSLQLRTMVAEDIEITEKAAPVEPDPDPDPTGEHVVINQVYGAGGNSGATLDRDFVELYNPTGADVNMNGWSVQYASATSNKEFSNIHKLTGTIKAGGYYLLAPEKGGSNGDAPKVDADEALTEINMAASNLQLALVSDTTAISNVDDETVVDFVGAGTATRFEGTVAPAPDAAHSIIRTDGKDTDDNGADFKTTEPNPRNSTGETVEPEPGTGDYAIYEVVDTPVTGETYLIVNPTAGHALTSVVGDKEYQFKGAEVTVAEGKAYIKTDDEATALFTAAKDETEGTYTFTQGEKTVSAYISGTNANLSMDADGHESRWELSTHTAANKSHVLTAKDLSTEKFGPVHLEWYENYKVFSAYAANSPTSTIYEFAFYKTTGSTTDKPPVVTEPEPEPGPERPAEATLTTTVEHGDQFIIYNPGSKVVMSSEAKPYQGKEQFPGITAEPAGDKITLTDDMAIFTAHFDGLGYISFVREDGKYLTSGATGSNLTAEDAPSAYSLWELEPVEGSEGVYRIKNVNAKFSSSPQYLEYFHAYTTYSYNSGNDAIYQYSFYKTGHVELEPPAKEWRTDGEVVDTIAKWGGGGPYDDTKNATSIKGDIFNMNDMLDTSVYTAVVGGKEVKPFTTGKSAGTDIISAWYMGGTGIGSGSDDYAQFALSTAGYGDMTMSLRMRASNTGPGEFKAQYSTDGSTFYDIANGTYEFSYTAYSSDGSTSIKEGSGKITDGLFKTSLAPTYYVSFTIDIPAGAENAESLLIRLVPTGVNAKGSDKPTASGTLRIDTVKIVGSPIVDDAVVGYVAVDPDGKKDQAVGTELTMSTATEGAVIKYRFVDPATGESEADWQTYSEEAKPKLDILPADLEVKAEKDGKESAVRRFHYASGTVAMVNMKPNGGGLSTAGGSAEIVLTSPTEGATIHYASYTGERPEEVEYSVYSEPITVEAGFGTLTVEAYATKEGYKDSVLTTRTFTERTQDRYQLFFGQMHSHTSYSDGAGTAAEAFEHVKGLDQTNYNMDFLSVTDHSNSFDDAGGSKTINDAPEGEEWNEGKRLAAAATDEGTFVGIFGYEMTWSNGLGHINTFNTTGYQDRTQSAYTSFDQSLQNYYAMLKTAGDSISQFNHPGTTFGDFSDFAHYDTEIDKLITLIEVGNGEGAIGSSGYFPSYEYYTRALDKGWHVAPTNNQDNHKGGWGSANNARDVVLVDELTEAAIYDAMRNYRVYATEDINLEIYYTLDGNIMGTILDESAYEGKDTALIRMELNDPNTADQREATVQVIVNGGKMAAETTTTLDSQVVELEVPTTYNYYYIKVVEADGDIAVTAPVWIGNVEAIGVSTFEADNPLTIVNEEQSFTMSMYNNEEDDLIVTSVTVTDEKGNVVASHSDITDPMTGASISKIPSMGTANGEFTCTFDSDGVHTLKAVVAGTLNGQERTYEKSIEVTAMPGDLITKVIVDGTHYNDYVTGYYGGQMGNMTALAGDNGVRVEVVKDKITSETLEGCSLLVISAPAKRSDNSHADAGNYSPIVFDEEFIAVVKEFVEGGGSVVLCGLADYQDRSGEYHSSKQINRILEAIGSTMRLNDDQVVDDVNHANQNYRLYPTTFNSESRWCTDVMEGQEYSFYSGCSVDIGSGEWLVKGWETTYSNDADNDGAGGIELGNDVYMLGAEDTSYGGTVFVAGTVFLSDYEVKTEAPDNIFDKKINRSVYENILKFLCSPTKTTDIAVTRQADLNRIFVVEGYVTAGRENANNAFFDAIYIQDASGGTCVFPYSTDGLKLGTKVRVLGYTDAYQGDREIQVISLTVLNDAPEVQEPKEVTTAEAADYEKLGGQLLKVSGTVSNVVMASGRISQFDLTDSSGTKCTVFIDGYIWDANGNDPITGKLQAGATATAVGLSYLHPEGDSEVSVCVLRVRDCGEITFTAVEDEDEDETPNVTTDDKTENGETTTETTAKPDAVVSGGKASSSVSSAMGAEIVDQARKNGSDTVTIAPEVKKDVDSASVTIPGNTVKSIGERTDADLKVETPVGDVTIPNEALAELGSGGRVTVSAERDGDAVSVEITSGGETVESVPGGIRAALPLEDGQVAVLVDADGNETIIPKSVVEDGVTYVMLDGSATVKVVDNSVEFEDVSDGDWFVGSVDFASSHGLVNGVGKACFAPGSDMTRAMLATVLWRLESEADAEGTGAFADAKSGLWYSEGVAWAGENGVINGTGNGNFEPERAVTRQEMAVMMYNYARFVGLDTTVGADLADFGDGAEVDSWAKDAMAWAVAAGLIRGTGAGLEPDATATRAQVVTVMERLVGLMVK